MSTHRIRIPIPIRAAPHRQRQRPEDAFQAQIIQLATLHGWTHYHTHDSRKSVAGFPDLILIRGAVLLAVEVKQGTNTTTDEQRVWLQHFRDTGAGAWVYRPTPAPTAEQWPHVATAVPVIGRAPKVRTYPMGHIEQQLFRTQSRR